MGYAELGTVRLHYVEQGEGPLVVLLHGFPEFWYGWRHQIGPLAEAGFRVVAPDLRGYNLSSKPRGRAAYALPELARDVAELIDERGARAGARRRPRLGRRGRVDDRDAPPGGGASGSRSSTRRTRGASSRPSSARARPRAPGTWRLFQLPWLPEFLGPKVFPQRDDPAYREAWAQPGALTAMLNYYRAMTPRTPIARVAAPTRVIWGRNDRYLMPSLAEPPRDDVPNLERVVVLDTSHWVQHEAPEEVSRLLAEFFSLP